MKRRLISLVLCACFFLCMSTPIAHATNSLNVTITKFENFSATGQALIAESTVSEQATAEGLLSDGSFYLSGYIPLGEIYNISISIEDGKFESATEENNNYDLLSVISFGDIVRVVLKDVNENNMYYIEFSEIRLASLEAYNVNWYHDFLAPEVEEVYQPSPYTQTDHDKTYSTTTTIYGDVYKEILVINFPNDWDNPVTTGSGFNLITKMVLESKTTEITRSGTTTPIVQNGNSLFVNQIRFVATPPYGEYARKADTQFTGTEFSPGSVSLDVGFAIPRLPFLSFNISEWASVGTSTIGSSTTYFELDGYEREDEVTGEPKLPMAIRVNYTDPNIWLEDATNEVGINYHHKVVIETTLKTHDNYVSLGTKGYAYRWDYCVGSDGNCNGVAVTMFSEPQYFQNTLYYTLNQS